MHKKLKFVVLGLGLAGTVACFLPYVEMADRSASLWQTRQAEAATVYLTLIGFALPTLIAALAALQGKMLRWQAAAATVGFLLALAMEPVRTGMTAEHGALGAKIAFAAAVLGLIAGIAGVARPERLH